MTTALPYTQSVALVGVNAQLPIVVGAITSKVPLENDLLEVTLFTFGAGQGLTTHTSPKAVVVTLLEGEMEFILADSRHKMVAGDSIYLAPNAPHSLTATADSRLQLVMVATR